MFFNRIYQVQITEEVVDTEMDEESRRAADAIADEMNEAEHEQHMQVTTNIIDYRLDASHTTQTLGAHKR